MGNNNKGRELVRIQSQVSDMLAAVGDYITRFDVRVEEDGYHIVVGLTVPTQGLAGGLAYEAAMKGLPQMGNGVATAVEMLNTKRYEDDGYDEEEVVAAVELQVDDVVSPRFVASNGVTTSVAEQTKEKRPVVRRYQQINHVPLTRDGIKNQIDKEEE